MLRRRISKRQRRLPALSEVEQVLAAKLLAPTVLDEPNDGLSFLHQQTAETLIALTQRLADRV